MNRTITGRFDVQLTPEGAPDSGEGATLARLSIEKRYHGALDATARGTMLSATTATEGSAAYVAVERVQGTLDGRQGSFALVHRGIMHANGQELSITVVPESGTGELRGLRGTLAIRIESGVHFYDLDYDLD